MYQLLIKAGVRQRRRYYIIYCYADICMLITSEMLVITALQLSNTGASQCRRYSRLYKLALKIIPYDNREFRDG